jgi:hypothetical protein
VNGFTSADVIAVELPALDPLEPDFVTLLIGVNDVVQGVPEATYRRNLGLILDELVARVGSGRVLVVTTPDYTVTPAGADYGDPAAHAAAIRAVNAVLTSQAEARDIAVVDVHDLSLLAATDRSLVARDGLHPSGSQYACGSSGSCPSSWISWVVAEPRPAPPVGVRRVAGVARDRRSRRAGGGGPRLASGCHPISRAIATSDFRHRDESASREPHHLAGGRDTVIHLLGGAMWALATRPADRARLGPTRRHPAGDR